MPGTYEITIEFIGGILAGLTHTDTVVRFDVPAVGWVCKKPIGGQAYRVLSVVRIK